MKAVLLSIKPQYCELIANGKKTIEIRKTKPKLKTPFKCYIYETKAINHQKILVDLDGNLPTTYAKGSGKMKNKWYTKHQKRSRRSYRNGKLGMAISKTALELIENLLGEPGLKCRIMQKLLCIQEVRRKNNADLGIF